MQELRTPAQERAEDIFFGQVVIIWARWFFILAGIILTLWSATTVEEVTLRIVLVIALMAMNFFLHGRYLIEKPANERLILAASILDLAIVTAIVGLWAPRGYTSPFFVLYYPMLLAFAFVFPQRTTIAFTVALLVAYTAICLAAGWDLSQMGNIKGLVMRLITLATTGALGSYYWRIQRERRRAASTGVSLEEPAVMPTVPRVMAPTGRI